MKRKILRRKIYWFMSMLALVTCALTFCATLAVSYQTALLRMEKETSRQTALVAAGLEEIRTLPDEERQAYLTAVGNSDPSRITLIEPDGTVVFDSNSNPREMENHLERPEVQEALKGGSGASTRTSATLGRQTYYAAIQLSSGEVLRLSNTTDIVTGDLKRAVPPLILIALLVCGGSVVLAHSLTARLVAPINMLNLEQPLENDIYEEFTPLLKKIHTQNAQIDQQIGLMRRKQIEFEAITSNMAEGLVVLDDRLRILSANDAAVRLMDADTRRWNGENLILFSRNPELGKKARAAITGSKKDMEMENREGAHLHLYFSPVMVEDTPRGCVLLIVDGSERYAAERSRREFTANVSHELKTPLTSISGYAEMIVLGLAKPDDVRGFAEKIHAEAGRLITLVEDIMKLSRLDESLPAELPFENVDVYALSGETIERLRQTAEQMQVTLRLEGAPVTVRGVRQMLGEVVYNLCENAIKYNRPGGEVKVTVSAAPGGVRLSVEDNGIGISPEDQRHIFERFYRADKSHSRTVGGTGLGLAIVKHVCEIHGAVVHVDSVLGKGSRFVLTFPGRGE